MVKNRTNTSLNLDFKIIDWLNTMENKSDYVNDVLLKIYNKDSNPFTAIDKLDTIIFEAESKKIKMLEELNKIAVEGNLKEREEAQKILQDEKDRIVSKLKKLLPALDVLQKHPKWKGFVKGYEEMTTEQRFDFIVKLQTEDISEARWSFINEMFKLFTKEQLLGNDEIKIEDIKT